MVKNLPANAGDSRVAIQSLGQEDPLAEKMTTHSSILPWEIPWTEEHRGGYSPQGLKELDKTERLSTHDYWCN